MRRQIERHRDDTRCDRTERAGTPGAPVDGPQRLLGCDRVMAIAIAVVGVSVPTRVVVRCLDAVSCASSAASVPATGHPSIATSRALGVPLRANAARIARIQR